MIRGIEKGKTPDVSKDMEGLVKAMGKAAMKTTSRSVCWR
jgi:hypothetical protein